MGKQNFITLSGKINPILSSRYTILKYSGKSITLRIVCSHIPALNKNIKIMYLQRQKN